MVGRLRAGEQAIDEIGRRPAQALVERDRNTHPGSSVCVGNESVAAVRALPVGIGPENQAHRHAAQRLVVEVGELEADLQSHRLRANDRGQNERDRYEGDMPELHF